MRLVALSILLVAGLSSAAQTMTTVEKSLRQEADFTSFINTVKKNTTASCLCNTTEYVVFSFTTKGNKTASLCVAKNLSATKGYLIYRFGTKAKTELSFPADTVNSLSQFSFAHYNRGGGKQNAAMYVNSLHFSNGDYTYTLHDNWSSEDGQYAKGIIITHNKTGKSTTIDAKGKVIGSLFPFANSTVVKESDEL